MRSDMAKVVTERPRRGGGVKHPKGYKKLLQQEGLDRVNFESTARHRRFGHDAKEFTDVLGPIKGFLRKSIGRPWDKVFSEVCEHLPANSIQGSHIRGHIDQYVERDIYFVGNVPYHNRTRNWYPESVRPVTSDSSRHPTFYVDPHGILRLAPQERIKHRYGVKTERRQDGDTQYHKIDGIWYAVTVAKANPRKPICDTYDFATLTYRTSGLFTDRQFDAAYRRDTIGSDRFRLYGDSGLIGVAKRQLSSRDVKKLRLHEAATVNLS